MDTTDIPVPPGPNSGEYSILLVFVNDFSKWIEGYPCKTRQAAEIVRYNNHFLGIHQDTEEILTDNGAKFRGEVLRNLVLHGVSMRNTAPHMWQSNGLVENANRVIKTALRRNIGANDTRPWPDIVDHILVIHRGTPHESTGLTPFQLRTNSLPCVTLLSLNDETTLPRRTTRATIKDKAQRHLELMEKVLPRLTRKRQRMTQIAHGKQVRSYEARNGNAGPRPQYKLEDIMQVRKYARQGKLAPRFFGRFLVIELGRSGVNTVRLALELSGSRSAHPIIRRVSYLRPLLPFSSIIYIVPRSGRGRRLSGILFSLPTIVFDPASIAISFSTEQVINECLMTPRGRIATIRQVQRPRLSPDLLRFATFFNTTAIHAAEFRFVHARATRVLAEISAFQRLSSPGVSHVSVIVTFTGDITTLHLAICGHLSTVAGLGQGDHGHVGQVVGSAGGKDYDHERYRPPTPHLQQRTGDPSLGAPPL
ncbi:hypothetical protein CBR_g23839 [Chara braunii]|uniref:Integrase catalytic domain-containing protein n=1 Tax=Chara braunii TaxID=69332 RepID=A0A388JVP9_CHABU|nr:hypothetical protein CBR_g23839 [Chara braunii]|eukprot:GBG61889.1 hypothetical protein CBR_g23839 [Chara braunii]